MCEEAQRSWGLEEELARGGTQGGAKGFSAELVDMALSGEVVVPFRRRNLIFFICRNSWKELILISRDKTNKMIRLFIVCMSTIIFTAIFTIHNMQSHPETVKR
jgi:hypothetical protein